MQDSDSSSSNNKLRITHYSHKPSHAFDQLIQSLNLDRDNVNQFDPSNTTAGTLEQICDSSDLIVAEDTLSLTNVGSLLTHMSDGGCRNAKVIVKVSGSCLDGEGSVAGFASIKESVGKAVDGLVWVVDSSWESRWLRDQLGNNVDVRVIRFVQTVSGPLAKPVDDQTEDIDTVGVMNTNVAIEELLARYKIPHRNIEEDYQEGVKAVVDFPCQASANKLSRNIAAGLVTFIPTPRLFAELIENNTVTYAPWTQGLDQLANWSNYVEYYDPIFEPYVHLFDSFEELASLVKVKTVTVGEKRKNVKLMGPGFLAKLGRESLGLSIDLFKDVGFGGFVEDLGE
ncbi:hypothetical protein HDU76_007980 [Blyttiomyces sp. JEL0837]|nr:hypothetical protein HDU76_007980 [Blyttiomyces sp. JEL0837]